MIMSNEFCEITMEESLLIDGGISTEVIATGLVTAAGIVVGAAVGGAIGGPVGAAIAGEKGAQIGAFLGSIVVGYVAEKATVAVINGMASN